MSKINNKLKIIINSTYLLNNRLLNNSKNLFKRLQAFTLLELIVVIAVISILAVIALPSFNKAIEESKSKSTIANMKLLIKQIQNDIANTGGVIQSFGTTPHSGILCPDGFSDNGLSGLVDDGSNLYMVYGDELLTGSGYPGLFVGNNCSDGKYLSYAVKSYPRRLNSNVTIYPLFYLSLDAMSIYKKTVEFMFSNNSGYNKGAYVYSLVTNDNTKFIIIVRLPNMEYVCMGTDGDYK
ncbi:MAG: prepilin-type N-terminal cleavage/methylation domain-containing protein, partial [Cyanobium sp. MAG06]|nr:prepilin-type N-terminal cleavage/methylation domain-containing protein [Cyanobium sp. MAG06]